MKLEEFKRAKLIEAFDEELYLKILKKFVVKDGEVVVTLLDGSKVECEI